jgi:hypothetical protein
MKKQKNAKLTMTNAQRKALDTALPLLAAHCAKLNEVYREANAEGKDLIRANNPIYNAVLRLTEAGDGN